MCMYYVPAPGLLCKIKDQIFYMAGAHQNYSHGTDGADDGCNGFNYLIVRPEKGGIRDLFRYTVWSDVGSGLRFLESSDEESAAREAAAQRWVLVVSIIARKIIAVLGKPMEWIGYVVDFILNLLSQNGDLPGLLYNLVFGNVTISLFVLFCFFFFFFFPFFNLIWKKGKSFTLFMYV